MSTHITYVHIYAKLELATIKIVASNTVYRTMSKKVNNANDNNITTTTWKHDHLSSAEITAEQGSGGCKMTKNNSDL